MNLGKTIKLISTIFVVSVILLTTGCSKQNHELIINNFNTRPSDFSDTKENVSIEAKKLTKNEFNEIFPGPNFKKKKFYKKYKIAQVDVKNNSSQNYNIQICNEIINKSDLNDDGRNIKKIKYASELIVVPAVVFSTFNAILFTLFITFSLNFELYINPTNFKVMLLLTYILPIVAGTYAFYKLNKYFKKLRNKKIEESNNSVIKFFNENVFPETGITLSAKNSIKKFIIFNKKDKFEISLTDKEYPNNILTFYPQLN
ncbi:hypothetical protein KJ644_00050 [Candidatus Dependentiae bacterium]|nr:hypothetical protein [Candidatus Dependentiae bacterium]MBU4386850.1 hypothetical protein [Candidatus Dependentiae bacterium]MCG2756320.1 hypothetical protein [Candidatus Dependentiae bacterium]